MGSLGRYLRTIEGDRVAFQCPGCGTGHVIRIGGSEPWTFNGDTERPTFHPSVLINGYAMSEKGKAEYLKWCEDGFPDRDEERFDGADTVCHSFIREGNIQFLDDCTHKLKGQTVPLPDFDFGRW